VAGFGNPDWKRTHKAATRTAVPVTMLQKQGGTYVGSTVMDELGFGFVFCTFSWLLSLINSVIPLVLV
jgi:hypothetical protein